ncbi:hypothetical protein ABK040_007158 [Willaertia magna]
MKRKIVLDGVDPPLSNNLLRMIFPNKWKTLYKFIEHIFCEYNILDVKTKLTVPSLQHLLHKSYIVVPNDSPSISSLLGNNSFEVSNDCKQSDIVDRAIEYCVNNVAYNKNVLALGFASTRFGADFIGNSVSIQAFLPNSLVNIVKSKDWEKLQTIIGDFLMDYILKYCIVLVDLPNSCLLQVTGNSLSTYVLNKKNLAPNYTPSPFQKKEKRNLKEEESSHLFFSDLYLQSNFSGLIETPNKLVSTGDSQEDMPPKIPPLPRIKRRKIEIPTKKVKSVPPIQTKLKKIKKAITESNKKLNDIFLPRQISFYSNRKTPLLAFPQNHIFNRMEPNINGAKKLFYFIFIDSESHLEDISLEKQQKFFKGYGNLLELLISLKENQFENLQRASFILSYHCPIKPLNLRKDKEQEVNSQISIRFSQPSQIEQSQREDLNNYPFNPYLVTQPLNEEPVTPNTPKDFEKGSFLEESEQFENLMENVTPYHQVATFIKAILRKIIPLELVGGENNMNLIFNNIDKVVKLGRYETLTLNELMHRIKITDFKWIKNHQGKTDKLQLEKQKIMVQKLILFLFKNVILVLMSTYFYITESDQQRTKLIYFRREIWDLISKSAWNNLNARDSVFRKIEKAEASEILRHKKIPCSTIRLLPKQTNARPIVNLGKNRFSSTPANILLRDLLYVLKFECERGDVLGSSVFNPLGMYSRLLPFVVKWKEQESELQKKQQEASLPLYIVKVDIKGAYDSIPHQKLYDVISKIISEEEYIVMKFNVIRPYIGKIISKYEKVVCTPNKLNRFTELAKKVLSQKYNKAIFIDQVSYNFMYKEKILDLLNEHIFENILKAKGQYFIQHTGIPQGSITSPLLCSCLYADFEKHHLFDLPGTTCHPFDKSSTTIITLSDERNESENSNIEWNYFSDDNALKFLQFIPEHGIQSLSFPSQSSTGDTLFTPPEVFAQKEIQTMCSPIRGQPVSSPVLGQNRGTTKIIASPMFKLSGNSSGSSSANTNSSSNSSNSSVVFMKTIGVLLRLIDDFLYITTHKIAAEKFVSRIHAGEKEYGIKVNPLKTKLNFDFDINTENLSINLTKETIIKWCGFIIETTKFQILVDYSKYWDCDLNEKISKDCKNPGFNLSRKLKQAISWKCNPLIIDNTINTVFTSLLNIYQLFIFIAMKFHCLVKYKTFVPHGKNSMIKFYLHIITDIIGYMWISITNRKKIIRKHGSICFLTQKQVKYLGLVAFQAVLQKKNTHYFSVLESLKEQINNLKDQLKDTQYRLLRNVSHRKHSSDLLEKISF